MTPNVTRARPATNAQMAPPCQGVEPGIIRRRAKTRAMSVLLGRRAPTLTLDRLLVAQVSFVVNSVCTLVAALFTQALFVFF